MTGSKAVNEDSAAPRPSAAALSGSIIVRVGSEGKEYTLHTVLLTHHSGFFSGALSGNFKETDDGVIPLDDADDDAFEVFVDWMYKDQVPDSVQKNTRVTGSGFDPEVQRPVSLRFRTYVLADRILAPGLKDILFDITYQEYTCNMSPSMGLVVNMFNNLPEGDMMLQLFVDAHCLNGGAEYYREYVPVNHLDMLPPRFMVKVMHKQLDLAVIEKKDWKFQREDYVRKPIVIR